MGTSEWFDDIPVIGRMPQEQAAGKLREMGEDEAPGADLPEEMNVRTFGGRSRIWPFGEKPYQHTAHAFGFLGKARLVNDFIPIRHAGNIEPDTTLKNSRIRITLNRLQAADYPGSGTHRVLFDFYAQNQISSVTEHLHFNATCRIQEGQEAGFIGFPLFLGLNVGRNGLSFKCYTVNVKNDKDEAFLDILESDEFRAGLKLANTIQPAIVPFSELALGITKAIAKKNRNVPVQEFSMGLDFSDDPMGVRLAEGSYIAVQIPDSLRADWDWGDWAYNPQNGRIVRHDDPSHLIEYNYIVLGITRYEEE